MNSTTTRILHLRQMGYRLWRIAADVRLPLHVVAAVISRETGIPPEQWRHGYELRSGAAAVRAGDASLDERGGAAGGERTVGDTENGKEDADR